MAEMHAQRRIGRLAVTTTLTICTTCKFSPTEGFDEQGRTGGELLHEAVAHRLRNRGGGVRLVGQECLWACRFSCTAIVQAPGRMGYLAGRFEPGAEAAAALAAWCEVYDRSATGEVPFDQWPEGMKGHFIARMPASKEW
jgi:predicted metal-binding protein